MRVCGKSFSSWAVVIWLVWAPSASAENWIVSMPAAGLRLYSEPDGTKRAGELKSGEVALPIALIEEEGDFGRIATPKGTFWVDIRRAQIKRGVVAECPKGLAQNRTQVASAGTRGAGDGCNR
jgi:hypothetical protein